MKSLKLTSTRVWRTYKGGSNIDRFLGNAGAADSHYPEDWIASTVMAGSNESRGDNNEGLSEVCGGGYLRDYIKKDPESMLGAGHAKKYGANMGVLVKLLDAGERLTVQVHPDNQTAKKFFNSDFGKTEAWHFLACRMLPGNAGGNELNSTCESDSMGRAYIYLGFKKGITKERWRRLFELQDIDGMLDCLHKIPVAAGDTYIVKGGVPHAIGEGCFLAEIQEPTDYTIRMEKTSPSGFAVSDEQCHLGIGFDKMFECFNYDGLDFNQTVQKYRLLSDGRSLINKEHTDKFSLSKLVVEGHQDIDLDGSFKILIVTSGGGELCEQEGTAPLKKGDRFFIPACAEGVGLRGNMEVLVCKGPAV